MRVNNDIIGYTSYVNAGIFYKRAYLQENTIFVTSSIFNNLMSRASVLLIYMYQCTSKMT